MSLQKRLRVVLAAVFQQWHQRTCCECGFTWMAFGPDRPELIRTCDDCEVVALDLMLRHAEREYDRVFKGVA